MKEYYICTTCTNLWEDTPVDNLLCPNCGSGIAIPSDREIKEVIQTQTVIIEAYGKQFIFNIPHKGVYAEPISITDNETKTCVLLAGEDVIQAEEEKEVKPEEVVKDEIIGEGKQLEHKF